MRNTLAARIERLEKVCDTGPGIFIIWGNAGESEAEARARTMAELGVTKMPLLPVVFVGPHDLDL